MRIGLLGGSFDPPHQGHIYISLEVLRRLNLKQIWWLPAKNNPFKKTNSPFPVRFYLCSQLIGNQKSIFVKDYELKVNSCYSFDVLKSIVERFSGHQFYFIIGDDNLANFHLWKNWRELVKLIPLVVCRRSLNYQKLFRSKAFIYAKKLKRVHFLKIKPCPISSTKLRNEI